MTAFWKVRACSLCFLLAAMIACGAGLTCTAQTAQSSASFQQLSSQAQAALDADKLDDAIPLFRKALALNPRWAEGWWSLGTVYYDQDRYAEAALAFQKVVALDPKHGTAHALLGLSQFELGQDAAALRNIEASKEFGADVDPQLRNVIFYHEGVLLQRSGRFVAAQVPFASLCRGGTRNEEILRAFGMAALHMRDKSFPSPGSEAGAVVLQVGRAECLAAQTDYDGARREFTLAVASYPHFPYLHYAFGRVLVDESDMSGAIAEFKSELAEGHDRVLDLLQLAAAEYRIDPAAGIPHAEEAVKLAPQMPFAHLLLGLLFVSTGAYEKALPQLEIARNGLPEDKKVFWALGSVYQQMGRLQDAARARAEFQRLSQKAAQQPSETFEPQDIQISVGDGPQPAPKN